MKTLLACAFTINIILRIGIAQPQNDWYQSSNCVTPDKKQGTCVDHKFCPKFKYFSTKPVKTPEEFKQLEESFCQIDIQRLYLDNVCCPFNWITRPRAFNYVNYQANCRTFDDKVGTCIPVLQCPGLIDLRNSVVRSNGTDLWEASYLLKSQCGAAAQQPIYIFKTCCPIDVPETRANQVVKRNNNNKSPLLPEDCGLDLHSRIVGGTTTEPGEYPWMALLIYRNKRGNDISLDCAGTLISSRYVLTAAHCVEGNGIGNWRFLTAVRLGEYDTSTENDCLEDTDGSVVCIDRPVEVAIEERIVHHGFKSTFVGSPYDIALLRLSREVTFTKYVKPICLSRSFEFNEVGKVKFTAAGWGITENGSKSAVKLKVNLPWVRSYECQVVYERSLQKSFEITDYQLCAGGELNQDTCSADSGGPLMHLQRGTDGKSRWSILGIVSFGASKCGQTGLPGVYTKVSSYYTWITRNIRR